MVVAVAGCLQADVQAPGVPLRTQAGQESQYKARLLNAAKDLQAKGDGLRQGNYRNKPTKNPTKKIKTNAPATTICVTVQMVMIRWPRCSA